jgi:hypothetical protein
MAGRRAERKHHMSNITVAPTPEARAAYEKYRRRIEAAALRYPVVIGPSGVVFYDQREYYPNARD